MNPDECPHIRSRVKEFREAQGLTQKALANSVGIGVSQIYSFERGTLCPNPDTRRHMCAILNTTETDLWPDGVREDMYPIHRPHRVTPISPEDMYTGDSIRRSANIHVGDKVRVKIGVDLSDTSYAICTVVEENERWFRVVSDRIGWSECFPYQELFESRPKVKRGAGKHA